MSIKTTMKRFHELDFPSLTELLGWLKRSCPFNQSNLHSPSVRVAVATSNGVPLAYAIVEKVLLVRAVAVNPHVSPELARTAGDALDREIAAQGIQAGVSNCIIAAPADFPATTQDEDDLGTVRLFERTIRSAPVEEFNALTEVSNVVIH
jgi:hypothetical protein